MRFIAFSRNTITNCLFFGAFIVTSAPAMSVLASDVGQMVTANTTAQNQLVSEETTQGSDDSVQEPGASTDSRKSSTKEKKDFGFDKFAAAYLHTKLQIGTRSVYRTLTKSDSGHRGGTYGTGTYLGTIYALDEKQDITPKNLFLRYSLTEYFGIELAYDSMEAKTLAIDSFYHYEKSDGDVMLSGPTISFVGSYPNDTSFTPYLGIGLGFFDGNFDRAPVWAHSDWGTSSRDRVMVVDNSTAFLLSAGVTWAAYQNWSLDCSIQYTKVDPDATFYGYTDGILDETETGHFPMDNVAFRLGIEYSF